MILNYDFKMEYFPFRKSGHADSRLVLIKVAPFKDIVIAALREKNEIENILCNIICDYKLLYKTKLTLENKFIIKIKKLKVKRK